MKREKEKAVILEEEKFLNEELQNLLPNAFERIMSLKKTREQYSRDEAQALKEEFQAQKSADIHVFLKKEQKERILAIADSLGPT